MRSDEPSDDDTDHGSPSRPDIQPYLGIIAHEIGGCVSPVKMQLALLRTGRLGVLNPQQDRVLRVAERSIERMTALMGDLTDLGRIEAGRMQIDRRETELGALVQDLAAAFSEVAEQAEVALTCQTDTDLTLRVDSERMMQVIANLLSNAIKFTPPGGQVAVSARRDGPHVDVVVRDSGAGLERAQMAELFQPFVQVHDPDSAPAGTGLGLYIAREIVVRHEGEIFVTSAGTGKGSMFTVRLPVAPAEDRTADGPSERDRP